MSQPQQPPPPQQPQPQPQPQQSAQQQQQAQQQAQQRQQVTINNALDTLCSMFETVDRDVVHMILIEGCGGNMEAAVEALLTMTGGISSSVAVPVTVPVSNNNNNNNNKSSVNLADDFLRPPSYFLSKYSTSISAQHKQIKQSQNDLKKEKEKQIIFDEIYAKSLFEDSLFTADLQANPEWVLEEINDNNNKNKKRFNRFTFNNNNNNNIDPSDINARRISFKQRFNSLGSSAKQKIGILAQKLQINKQQSKNKNKKKNKNQNKNQNNQHQYKNILTSLDDETLIDIDNDNNNNNNDIIQDAKEENRDTYKPPVVIPSKPIQDL